MDDQRALKRVLQKDSLMEYSRDDMMASNLAYHLVRNLDLKMGHWMDSLMEMMRDP